MPPPGQGPRSGWLGGTPPPWSDEPPSTPRDPRPAADPADDRSPIGEDADHVGAAAALGVPIGTRPGAPHRSELRWGPLDGEPLRGDHLGSRVGRWPPTRRRCARPSIHTSGWGPASSGREQKASTIQSSSLAISETREGLIPSLPRLCTSFSTRRVLHPGHVGPGDHRHHRPLAGGAPAASLGRTSPGADAGWPAPAARGSHSRSRSRLRPLPGFGLRSLSPAPQRALISAPSAARPCSAAGHGAGWGEPYVFTPGAGGPRRAWPSPLLRLGWTSKDDPVAIVVSAGWSTLSSSTTSVDANHLQWTWGRRRPRSFPRKRTKVSVVHSLRLETARALSMATWRERVRRPSCQVGALGAPAWRVASEP